MSALLPIKEECLKVLRSTNLPEIDKSSITTDTGRGTAVQIGNGAFCGVYRVRASEVTDPSDEVAQHLLKLEKDIGVKLAAVKSMHVSDIMKSLRSFNPDEKVKKVLRYYKRECAIWRKVSEKSDNARNNNLLKVYGFLESYEYSGLPAFVLEYYPLGDIREYIQRHTQPLLSNGQKLYVLSDVAKALDFMHSVCGFAHRDVKGANVLLEDREHRLAGVLGDFGSAKEFIHETPGLLASSSEYGGNRWSPPEYSHEGGFHNDKGPGDIWSLGCTMLEILQGADPWHQVPQGQISARIEAYEYPPRDAHVSEEHYEVMKKCWTREDRRPSASYMHVEIESMAQRACLPQ